MPRPVAAKNGFADSQFRSEHAGGRAGQALPASGNKMPSLLKSPATKSSAAWVFFALAVATYLSFSQAIFNDGDTSWHLAAGKLILSRLSVPQTDPFSFTFFGQPWTAHEWLAEALLAGALNLASWAGVALLVAAAMAALMLMVGLEIGRWLAPQRVVAVLAALFVVLAPYVLARPHVLAWPLLAGWTLILLRARGADRPPPFAWALLMLAWANLHGSFVMGMLLIGVFGLEALMAAADRKQVILGWGGFVLASLLAALLTPHGLEGLLFPLKVSAMETLPLIAEWRPTSLAEDKLFLLIAVATLALLLYRRPRISPVRWGLLALLLYLAVTHARHQPVLAIIATLLLVKPLAGGASEPPPVPLKPLVALLLSGFVVLGAVRLSIPLERRDAATYPVTAIRSLPQELRTLPVLNSYSFGGPLILNGVKPYIDGRADLYGDAFMIGHHRIMTGDAAAFDEAVLKWGIDWTILAPDEPLVPLLDRKPGWRRIYADDWAVVHAVER
jgi:hypothetical protein